MNTHHAEERRLVHVETIPIRWGDMDAMQHVNNVNYFRYMEQARLGWIDGLRDLIAAEGLGTVIVSTTCNYRRPLVYPGNVEVRVMVGRVGGSSVTTLYEMRLQGDPAVYADGSAVAVWINMKSGKAVRVPLALRERLGATGDKEKA
jgi:acyl-CoA thioester hydrolase